MKRAQHGNRELWWAYSAIAVCTAGYVSIVWSQGSIPAAREFLGHSLGIIGFALMIMTEVLYTWRKRSRSSRWGKMSSWLRFHIFTGLVGPYLVLLHTAWHFRGLAGIVMLLTIVVVVSGFIGRYIYTSIPRTVDGSAVMDETLRYEISQINQAIERTPTGFSMQLQGELRNIIAQTSSTPHPLQAAFGRGLALMRLRWQWLRVQRRATPEVADALSALKQRLIARTTLQYQVTSLEITRRMLALWHIVHVPLGLMLFSAAVVHILGAIYYATLLH